MAATYPGNIKVFTIKRNILDIVDAPHVNTIQEEVVALETAVGVNPQMSTAGGGSSLGAWSGAARTYGSLADRLANIEAGLLADTKTQYVRFAGAETITGLKTFSPGALFGTGAAGQNTDLVVRGGASGGGRALLDLQTGGSSRWQLFKTQGAPELNLWDSVNARAQVLYTPGTTNAAALTTFNSRVSVADALSALSLAVSGTVATLPVGTTAGGNRVLTTADTSGGGVLTTANLSDALPSVASRTAGTSGNVSRGDHSHGPSSTKGFTMTMMGA